MKKLITVSELVEKIARDEGLDDKATADAAAGRPAANAATLSDSESQLVSALVGEVEAKIKRFETECFGPLEEVCDELRRKLPENEARRDILDQTDAYNAAMAEAQKRSTAYEKFQDDRREILGERDAEPGDRNKFLAWMAVVIILEGMANSYFFAKGAATGLAGGFIYASGVALCNVAVAGFGAHWGARHMLNHLKWWPNKTLGGLLLLACTAGCFVIISFAAAYRGQLDALSLQNLPLAELSGKASSNTMEVLKSGDFSRVFASAEASVLFIVGAACAIFAGIKSYYFNDPCPGYAAIYRAKLQAYDKAAEVRKDRIQEIRKAVQAVRAQEKKTDKAELDKINGLSELAKQVGCALLTKYRDKNVRMRGDAGVSSPPEYFNDPLDPQGLSGATITGKYLMDKLDAIDFSMRKKLANLAEEIDNLVDRAEKEIDVLEAKIKATESKIKAKTG